MRKGVRRGRVFGFGSVGKSAGQSAGAALCALLSFWVGPVIFCPAPGVSTGLFFQAEYTTASAKMGMTRRCRPSFWATGFWGL